ncbi:hypothetical protein E2C01_015765 [Portunus trituberculatus]|uniref:Uncharacterized protein n=1 Tax=Portunus trituberculatus TaxID=210409 RepID=A0A5B7DNY0_PORTR|nr:hypothetical protein [Portunus trituberculatus]
MPQRGPVVVVVPVDQWWEVVSRVCPAMSLSKAAAASASDMSGALAAQVTQAVAKVRQVEAVDGMRRCRCSSPPL